MPRGNQKKKRKCPPQGSPEGPVEKHAQRSKLSDVDDEDEQLDSLKLTADEEDLAGRLSSTSEWLIRIAQSRGSAASVGIRILQINIVLPTVTLTLRTLDRQTFVIVLEGQWVSSLSSMLQENGSDLKKQVFVLSGHGAKIAPSGNKVRYANGAFFLLAPIQNDRDQSNSLCGSCEIADGEVLSLLSRRVPRVVKPGKEASSPTPDHHDVTPPRMLQTHATTVQVREESTSSPSPEQKAPLHLTKNSHPTPAWLTTPPRRAASTTVQDKPLPRKELPFAASAPSGEEMPPPGKRKGFFITTQKLVGLHTYTPISSLQKSSELVNVIGLVSSKFEPRRSSGGQRDFNIKVVLCDLHRARGPNTPLVTFMLFAQKEEHLPVCPFGSILALFQVKVDFFQGRLQVVGNKSLLQWCSVAGDAHGDPEMKMSENCRIDTAEKQLLREQFRIARQDFPDSSNFKKSVRVGRSLLKVSDIVESQFFDVHVEIVKVWDKTSPPVMYVTDYTSHPKLHSANDVHLQGASSARSSEAQGDGYVLPVSLWEDQLEIIHQVRVGMIVLLQNVRPKIQPNSYLDASMGGGSSNPEQERLRVLKLRQEDAMPLLRRRSAFLEQRRRDAGIEESEDEEQDASSNNSEETRSVAGEDNHSTHSGAEIVTAADEDTRLVQIESQHTRSQETKRASNTDESPRKTHTDAQRRESKLQDKEQTVQDSHLSPESNGKNKKRSQSVICEDPLECFKHLEQDGLAEGGDVESTAASSVGVSAEEHKKIREFSGPRSSQQIAKEERQMSPRQSEQPPDREEATNLRRSMQREGLTPRPGQKSTDDTSSYSHRQESNLTLSESGASPNRAAGNREKENPSQRRSDSSHIHEDISLRSRHTASGDSGQSMDQTCTLPPPGQIPLSQSKSMSSSIPSVPSSQGKNVATKLSKEIDSLPLTHLEDVQANTIKQKSDGTIRQDENIYRCRVQIQDMSPKTLRDFVHIYCQTCMRLLPKEHTVCVVCATIDDKNLRYKYVFSLKVADSSDLVPQTKERQSPTVNLLVTDADAEQFLHSYHPKCVREVETIRARLREHLGTLLGTHLKRYCEDDRAPKQYKLPLSQMDGQPFDVGVHALLPPRAGKSKAGFRYRMVGTTMISNQTSSNDVQDTSSH